MEYLRERESEREREREATITLYQCACIFSFQPFYFPEKTGFSIGADDDPSFYIMETHYDNPNKKSGI